MFFTNGNNWKHNKENLLSNIKLKFTRRIIVLTDNVFSHMSSNWKSWYSLKALSKKDNLQKLKKDIKLFIFLIRNMSLMRTKIDKMMFIFSQIKAKLKFWYNMLIYSYMNFSYFSYKYWYATFLLDYKALRHDNILQSSH